MNRGERFLSALGSKQLDRVPTCELHIDKSVIRRLAELLGVGAERADYIELYSDVVEKLDLDAVFTLFHMAFRGYRRKEHGINLEGFIV